MRIDIKENKHEKARSKAITDVSSSIKLDADIFEICSEVITNRQNPRRLADVFKMC
ncbi:MAG: hypothetical protein ABUL41_02920 [Chitinophagaceae bacterium]